MFEWHTVDTPIEHFGMPTKIVTTITSPGKLRLAALFKSASEPQQAQSSTMLQGRSLGRKFSPATA